jgi:hypothetical protein
MALKNGTRDAPLSAATPPAIEQLPGRLDPKDRLPDDTAPARDERTHAAPQRVIRSAPSRDLTPALPRERLACLARRIHALGERPLYELFRELEAGAPLHERLERYAALPADFIAALGGDRLPPLRSV